ncbi:hypothetical protein D3C72_1460950 [compost metagenome]
MVFVGIRRERRQNRRIHLRHLRREQRLIAEIHQRFVGVVAEERFDILLPAGSRIQLFRVAQLVVIKIHQQIQRKTFQLLAFCFANFLQPFLIFIADVIPVNRFVADDQANQIGGVGQLAATRPVHRQPEAGIEEERFQEHAGDFLLQRLIGLVILQHQLGFALERGTLFAPGIGRIHIFGLAQRRENRAVGTGVDRLHKADIRHHRLFVRRQ